MYCGFHKPSNEAACSFWEVAIFRGGGFTEFNAYKSETGLTYIIIMNGDIFFIPHDQIEGAAASPVSSALMFKWLTLPNKLFAVKDPQLDEV